MIKLKNILFEQGAVKTFVIQTPAPKAALDIVRSTKPRGAAFILKSTDVLGEEPSMDMIVKLLKLDAQFGEQSVWATSEFINDDYTDSFIYLVGPDLKDAQRKTKFVVMIVPKSYIVDQVLGPGETDTTKKQAVYEELVTTYLIGNASVMMQSEFDTLKTKIAPLLDKERIKKLEAELAKAKQALSTPTEPPVQQQTVISGEPEQDTTPVVNPFKLRDLITITKTTTVDAWTEVPSNETKQQLTLNINDRLEYVTDVKLSNMITRTDFKLHTIEYGFVRLYTDPSVDISITNTDLKYYIKISDLIKLRDAQSPSKIESLKNRLQAEPIKLNTKSDDVAYIQDLIYRIGMADSNLGETNNVPTWAAFRDAKAQFGTYGTRTKNFIDVVKQSAGLSAANSDITAEVLQLFLDAGKPLNITESRIKLKNLIVEQFVIKPEFKTTQTQQQEKPQQQDKTKNDKKLVPEPEKQDKKLVPEPEKQDKKLVIPSISDQDIKDSRQMEKIWQDVYNVLTAKPEKYFSKFSSWYNDQETEAADWLINAYNKAWGPALTKLSKSKSWYTQKNVKTINYTVEYIANKLIRKGYSGRVETTFYYLDKTNKWKKQSVKFVWNYM
jgi:hypothetical protein